MYDVFAFSIDSSMRVIREPYFFSYKGISCRYRASASADETDSLSCKSDLSRGRVSLESVFPVMAELISGISFYHDAPMDIFPGMVLGSLNGPWEIVNISAHQRKRIPSTQTIPEFLFIPDFNTPETSMLLRLYRKARASSDIFLEILFYWHVLTYPHKNEAETVKYVDAMIAANPAAVTKVEVEIGRIRDNPILSHSAMNISVGNYIRRGVKNALSHIVRESDLTISIEIDSIEQMRHLADVRTILKAFCRHKILIDNRLTFNASNIFSALNDQGN